MSPAPSKKSAGDRFRWTVLTLLFASTVINYMDRQILGILKPDLSRSLGWSETDYSSIVIAFQLAYAVGQLFCGPVIEWFGTRLSFAYAVVLWSLSAMAHGVVRGVSGFMAARFSLALGESANFPIAIRTVGEWFPAPERPFATGIFNAGTNVGAVFAPILVPLIAAWIGWRGSFIALGAAGFLWLIPWLMLYRPAQASGEPTAAGAAANAAPKVKVPWRRILATRAAWGYFATCILVGPVWWFYLFWLPDIFHKQFGLDMAAFGPPLVVVYGVTALGSIGGGWLSLWFSRLGASINLARKGALLICAVCTVSAIVAAHASHVWVATLCFSFAAAGHQGWSANMYSVTTDLFPKEGVAFVVGFGGTVAAIASVVFSYAVGHILQAHGGYAGILAFCGCAYVTALLIFHILVPRIEPVSLAA
ncbi:L-galactonate transporter [mine drainage metagenome]|uniref:L-galactonate transporter n=1 Tax=mine drainage metagenome TaxID=410659 RepID=A0A1J5S114_9ZZZZ